MRASAHRSHTPLSIFSSEKLAIAGTEEASKQSRFSATLISAPLFPLALLSNRKPLLLSPPLPYPIAKQTALRSVGPPAADRITDWNLSAPQGPSSSFWLSDGRQRTYRLSISRQIIKFGTFILWYLFLHVFIKIIFFKKILHFSVCGATM